MTIPEMIGVFGTAMACGSVVWGAAMLLSSRPARADLEKQEARLRSCEQSQERFSVRLDNIDKKLDSVDQKLDRLLEK